MALTPPEQTVLEDTVRRALAEDIDGGDVTSEATVDPALQATASLLAREAMVVSGLPVVEEVYAQIDRDVRIDARVTDGDQVDAGAEVAVIRGPATSILLGERVALNFAQRMCGVATLTRRYVDALPEQSATRITDTRKTTPGLRALERYAVRCGGGHNHRENLSAAVLIKDNHIAAAGGVGIAIARAKARAPHTSRIECEVETEEQLAEALEAGAEIIMLDNFDDDRVAAALKVIGGRAMVEASGGITLERVNTLGWLGVDVISIGALTHSAPAVDLALEWA